MTLTTNSREPAASPSAAPRRLAVFGSVAAQRPSRASVEVPPSAAREVLERVFSEIAAQAPTIARPVLDEAVAVGRITAAERDELLRELAGTQSGGEYSTAPGRSVTDGAAVREALAAIRRASPGIAEPILTAAVGDGLLSEAQEQRILSRLRANPAASLRPARDRD